MKTQKYFLMFTIVTLMLCVPASGDAELPSIGDKPVLLGRVHRVLAGVDKLYVHVICCKTACKVDSLVKELKTKATAKLNAAETKLKLCDEAADMPGSAELRIYIDVLELADSQQYVFHIQTSLAKKVYLDDGPQIYIKSDVWKTQPSMQLTTSDEMAKTIAGDLDEQVDAFISAYLAANSQDTGGGDLKTAEKARVTNNKFIASKNSKVFHKSDCYAAKGILPKNTIAYKTRAEAASAGKRPCKRCQP